MDRLRTGDIFFTRGTGRLSRLIRRFTRSRGEPITVTNHVGLIATAGNGLEAWGIEALSTVKFHKLCVQYRDNFEIAVFRPMNLSEYERRKIRSKAAGYVDKKYGYLKLLLHMGDWAIGGRYFFRRIGRMDDYPICSYLVAHCFKAAGRDFGIPSYAASPDDIWDFCVGNPKKYKFVWQKGSMYRK